VLAAVITWMAPAASRPGIDRVVATAPTAGLPAESEPPVATSVPAPPAVRPFLEPSGAGAVAYSSGDYEGALTQYRAAIERNPDDAESHSNLGQMLVRLNRPAEALPSFDRAIGLLPARWAYHFNRARAFSRLERWDEAISGYRQAQQLFPDDYATAFNLGQALHRKGDQAAAVDAYLRAIELDPSDATFRLALGISYERLAQRPAAAAAYAEYLRLLPDAADADRVRARIAQLTAAVSGS
jgi:tetratricopeptide (TPR) repeat protein